MTSIRASMLTSIRILLLLLSTALAPGQTGAAAQPVVAAAASTLPPVMVIGFVGGFIRHDNLVHSEVQVAAHLSQDYSDVDTEVFENYHRKKAYQKILRLLDTDHDGTLTVEEKMNARIIIYGHSWGASEGIVLARQLAKEGIPVLLTIQVDSVSKIGKNHAVIPANVAQAVNFYQPKGFLHGRSEIRAADAARTEIIGNFRFDYDVHPLSCEHYPWWDRVFVKHHTEIECDPNVWNQVEALIRSKLPPATRSESAQ